RASRGSCIPAGTARSLHTGSASPVNDTMIAVAQRRSLVLLLLALMLTCLGCRYGHVEGEAALPIPRWTAELPGRDAPLDLQLPVHLDGRLPRSPVDYTLRATVELPAAMRGRALTLAVPHMPAMA